MYKYLEKAYGKIVIERTKEITKSRICKEQECFIKKNLVMHGSDLFTEVGN